MVEVNISKSRFLSAVTVAQLSAELSAAGELDEPEDERLVRLREAEARLESVLDVNRVLHATLAERRRQMKESQAEVASLQDRLVGRSVEEPLRQAQIEELQGRLQAATEAANNGTASGPKTSRDAALLNREATKLEAKIEALNAINLKLADRHWSERAAATQHQSRLRTLGKRERELGRKLESIATQFTEASKVRAATVRAAPDEDAPRVPVDYRDLPGMSVAKLLGKQLRSKSPPPQRAPEPSTAGMGVEAAAVALVEAEQRMEDRMASLLASVADE